MAAPAEVLEEPSLTVQEMEPDPLLPPQLLPRPWPGARARELVARCWAALHERARGEARPALFRLYADITRETADRATR